MARAPDLRHATTPAAHRPAPPPSPPPPIHVVLVERDRMARLGLQRVLSTSAVLQVSGGVGTIREAEELPASLPVEVVLAGADVPDMDGVKGIDRLLTRFRRARVVLLGTVESSKVILAALRHGADGYLPRDISAEALVRSLRAVTHGEVAVPRALVQVVVNALRLGTLASATEGLLERLSPR